MENVINTLQPIVSVVMSVYNGQNYLRDAINSILNQTFSDLEFIIINDGSTDNSLSIIKSYSDKRIVLLDNETNKGLIYSLNRGLLAAKGKYIARMDADDICFVDRLQLQVNYFEANPKTVIVGGDYFLLNGNKKTYVKNTNDSDYQKAVLIFAPCFCHPTVMIKNIFKENTVFYNANYLHAEDYKLWTDIYSYGIFANINKPLIKYRHHANQVSNQKKESQKSISKLIREDYCNRLNFNLTQKQYETLNIVGNNEFIKSLSVLNDIEKLFFELEKQNNELKNFNTHSFQKFLFKFWLDSCGNTNLGIQAYSKFFRSQISSYRKLSVTEKSIFIAKCLIRKFRT